MSKERQVRRSLKALSHTHHYLDILRLRDREFRRFTISRIHPWIQSFLLLLVIKAAQKIGYWLEALRLASRSS